MFVKRAVIAVLSAVVVLAAPFAMPRESHLFVDIQTPVDVASN